MNFIERRALASLGKNSTPVYIDDYVEKWHLGEGPGLALHEYLGMTHEQYKVWFEKNELPPLPKNHQEMWLIYTQETRDYLIKRDAFPTFRIFNDPDMELGLRMRLRAMYRKPE